MSKFKVMLGGPCTGKSTRFTNEVERLSSLHSYTDIEETYTNTKGKSVTKVFGRYFQDINFMCVGRYNKKGMFVGLDSVQSSMTQDTLGELLSKHSNKIVFTEGNSSFSAARRLPTYMHSLGFAEVEWVVLYHADRSVCDKRKSARIEAMGKTVTQKQLDSAWGDNFRYKGLVARFQDEQLIGDMCNIYDSEARVIL